MNVATNPGVDKPVTEGAATLDVDVQLALDENEPEEPPSGEALRNWATLAYQSISDPAQPQDSLSAELTIRIVGEQEMLALNNDYRGKPKTTNVLSFPVDLGEELLGALESNLLGDIVLCHPVIIAEAKQQNKSISAHYAHMVTHGVLHLSGYDHQDDDSAERMEAFEKQILAKSGIANPYS